MKAFMTILKNKYIASSLVFFNIFCMFSIPVMAVELDYSVDDEIKKKYNTSKLEYQVPQKLPVTTPSSLSSSSNNAFVHKSSSNTKVVSLLPNNVIPYGTRLKVKSNQTVSDNLKEGSVVSFTTVEDTFSSCVKVPKGMIINGIIMDSHFPQLTGNGGLIKIELTSVIYNNKNYQLSGRVIKANNKKIFFNNIKGKRQYWSNVAKQIDKGEVFYGKTKKIASHFSNKPVIEILGIIPRTVGVVGYGVNFIISPACAIFKKGGRVNIAKDSIFVLKI